MLGQARGTADHNSSESSDDGTVDLANNTTTNSDYDVFHSNEQSCSNLTPPLLTSMSSPVAVDIASSSQEDLVRHVINYNSLIIVIITTEKKKRNLQQIL